VFGSSGYAGHPNLCDIRFLTKDRLLAITSTSYIELYNLEDVVRSARLEARFKLPFGAVRFLFPSDFHSDSTCARITATDEKWIWTTNPADRVISVVTTSSVNLIISARIFFMDIPPTWFNREYEDGRCIRWQTWGPQNSRCFTQKAFTYGVGGFRVVWAVPVPGSATQNLFQLHMTDFNPAAVARGVGRVVREPTICKPSRYLPDHIVTTSLPYLEVVNDHIFDAKKMELYNIMVDEEKVSIFSRKSESVSLFPACRADELTISLDRGLSILT